MIETKKLNLKFGNKKILEDIHIQIDQGDFIGLMGPNGSGKTTLIKILSGSLRNYEGQVSINLMILKKMSHRMLAKTIAVVPQEAFFEYPFTALEIVLMGRNAYQNHFAFESVEDIQIARRAMERCDCFQFAGRSMETLSGGEKQRVLLARALAQKPKILLLDEPASHLDMKHQLQIFELLRDLNQTEKLGIVCVMHDLNLANRYCRKFYFLKEGRVVLKGAGPEVFQPEKLKMVFDVPFEAIHDQGQQHYLTCY